jgi:hypothetical protein
MERLIELYKKLREKPYPAPPSNPEWLDLYAELDATDTYVAGLASSKINGDRNLYVDMAKITTPVGRLLASAKRKAHKKQDLDYIKTLEDRYLVCLETAKEINEGRVKRGR